MPIAPGSTAFTLLLSLLVALPSFAIDMNLPALTATGAALGAAQADVGLTMSTFMLGFAVAPLFYGPASDRYGRKPVVIFACALFVIAGVGCGACWVAVRSFGVACRAGRRCRSKHDHRHGHHP